MVHGLQLFSTSDGSAVALESSFFLASYRVWSGLFHLAEAVEALGGGHSSALCQRCLY